MKFGIYIIISLLIILKLSTGFIPYPFLANDLLGSFMTSVKVDEQIDISNFTDGESCLRECTPNDRRICHFYFTLKYYRIMGG